MFKSNNLLHRHLRSGLHPKASAPASEECSVAGNAIPSHPTPNIIHSASTDPPVEGYAFRGHRFVTALVMFFLADRGYELCFDTGCTMSLIDRKFLLETHPGISIKKMVTPMTLRGLGTNTHNASEYIKIKMYLPSKNGTVASIERDFHVVDDLTAKALIGIDIMKPEGIVLDLEKDAMKIGSCQNLEIPIVVTPRGSRTSATVYSSKRMTIPPHSNVAVSVTGPGKALALPQDRDIVFEPQTLDALSAYAHVVDHTMTAVFVRNDSDLPITLPRKQKFGKVSGYDAADCCYSVNLENHDLLRIEDPDAIFPASATNELRATRATSAPAPMTTTAFPVTRNARHAINAPRLLQKHPFQGKLLLLQLIFPASQLEMSIDVVKSMRRMLLHSLRYA